MSPPGFRIVVGVDQPLAVARPVRRRASARAGLQQDLLRSARSRAGCTSPRGAGEGHAFAIGRPGPRCLGLSGGVVTRISWPRSTSWTHNDFVLWRQCARRTRACRRPPMKCRWPDPSCCREKFLARAVVPDQLPIGPAVCEVHQVAVGVGERGDLGCDIGKCHRWATITGSPDTCRVAASNTTDISAWSRTNNKWPWSWPGPFGTKMPLD